MMGSIEDGSLRETVQLLRVFVCDPLPEDFKPLSGDSSLERVARDRLAFLAEFINSISKQKPVDDSSIKLLSNYNDIVKCISVERTKLSNCCLCRECYVLVDIAEARSHDEPLSHSLCSVPYRCSCLAVEWEFVYVLTTILNHCVECMITADGDKSGWLSVSEEKVMDRGIQCLLACGICRNLLPGVGVPLHLRTNLKDSALPLRIEPNKYVNERHLYIVTKLLILCISCKEYGPKLVVKCLRDVLAALFQMAYRPASKAELDNPEPCQCFVKDTTLSVDTTDTELKESVASPCQYDKTQRCRTTCFFCQRLCRHEKKMCEMELLKLLDQVYKPLVVRELMSLQRSYSTPNSTQGQKRTRRRPPQWFTDACGTLLSRLILAKNGVKSVIMGMFEGLAVDSLTWDKCEMIGSVIYRCPSQAQSLEKYHKCICPQLLDILAKASSSGRQQLASIIHTYMVLLDKNLHVFAVEYFFNPLLKPLMALTGEVPMSVDEKSITEAASSLHSLLHASPDPSVSLLVAVQQIVHPLFEMFCFSFSSASIIKMITKDILTSYSNHRPLEDCLALLFAMAFAKMKPRAQTDTTDTCGWQRCLEQFPTCRASRISFSFGADGGIMATCFDRDATSQTLLEMDGAEDDSMIGSDVRIGCLLELLGQYQESSNLASEFLLILLREFSLSCDVANEIQDSASLTDLDDKVASLHYNILLVSTIVAVCDKFGDKMAPKADRMLEFVLHTLRRCARKSTASSPGLLDGTDSELEAASEESVAASLGLVSVILTFSREALLQHVMISDITACLDDIARGVHSKQNIVLAKEIRVGLKSDTAYKSIPTDPKSDAGQTGKSSGSSSGRFEHALDDVASALVPMQGHGLVRLTQLLDNDNSQAWDAADRLLSIFLDKTAHDDSYVYLNAIQGLVALARKQHAIVVPKLAGEFARLASDGSVIREADSDNNALRHHHPPEVRCKVAEALVKSARCCGDFVPKYSQVLLASLLRGVRDSDDLVRASALSAVADVCKLLRFAIGNVLHEIVHCACSVVRFDKTQQVRRAGVAVIVLLLEGLGRDSIEALGDVLTVVYRQLKRTECDDDDPMIGALCRRGLAVLDDVMRSVLFPPESYKRIEVLR